jgi:predicted O-methyltransferase YrrM
MDETRRVDRIFERLAREEGLRSISWVRDDASRADANALVVADVAASGAEILANRLPKAPFVLLTAVAEGSDHPTFLTLLRHPDWVLLQRPGREAGNCALFMSCDHAPRSYSTIAPVVESIHGYLDPGQERFLFEKAKSLPDDGVILEIGSYHGRSTSALAFGCVGSGRKVYCVDLWGSSDLRRHSGFFNQFRNNLSRLRLSRHVVPLHGPSAQVLGQWDQLTGGARVEFVFDDASHQYDQTLEEWELFYGLVKDGGWIAFHDVRPCWPGPLWIWNNVAGAVLGEHRRVGSLACGRKVAGRTLEKRPASARIGSAKGGKELAVHFFTIVLNGMPFLPRILATLRELPFRWHWHVVEGVAELDFDTAWSKPAGGYVPAWAHAGGLSVDGTSEFLDRVAREEGGRVTVYRNEGGKPFLGKIDMINRPVTEITEACLLWEVDSDELWAAAQINAAREMFLRNPKKTAARYWSWYFVGPGLVTSTRHCYGNDPRRDGLRTWRFEPGMLFFSHEPPVLGDPQPDGRVVDVGASDPFTADEMEAAGVVFQHHAWATLEQARFKQAYCGYEAAADAWRALQAHAAFPVRLGEFFTWVGDGTVVDRAENFVERSLLGPVAAFHGGGDSDNAAP